MKFEIENIGGIYRINLITDNGDFSDIWDIVEELGISEDEYKNILYKHRAQYNLIEPFFLNLEDAQETIDELEPTYIMKKLTE